MNKQRETYLFHYTDANIGYNSRITDLSNTTN